MHENYDFQTKFYFNIIKCKFISLLTYNKQYREYNKNLYLITNNKAFYLHVCATNIVLDVSEKSKNTTSKYTEIEMTK